MKLRGSSTKPKGAKRPKGAKTRQPSLVLPQRSMVRGAMWVGIFVTLILGIVFSGLGRVNSAEDMRLGYQQLSETQRQQDALLAEHSRLLLERAALSSLQNIEQIAQSELHMEFPEEIGEVLQ